MTLNRYLRYSKVNKVVNLKRVKLITNRLVNNLKNKIKIKSKC